MGLLEYFFDYPYIALLQTAFMIWMLVDAYRRGAEFYWYWIILLVPGIGAWVYFFAVKVPSGDFRNLSLGGVFHRGPSLDQLRFLAEQTPTLTNHLNLAQRLIERREFAEAEPHVAAALKTEPEHGGAQYMLAQCQMELGRPREAVEVVQKLLQREPRWSNYRGWRLLIQARDEAGDGDGALESCRELARLAPTLEHNCVLAEHLIDQGQLLEAGSLLDRVLREYDFAPGPVRRRNGRWAGEARRLQKRLPAG
jgi:hypothetical protein